MLNSILKRFKSSAKVDKHNTQTTAEPSFDRIKLNTNDLIQLKWYSRGLNFNMSQSNHIKSFSELSGNHRSLFKGRGMDFDEVRPYQAGDDVKNIDWKVTARTNQVHTKVFKEERDRPFYLIVDFRSSMFFATRGCLKSIQAARLATFAAWIAASLQYRIGLIVITNTKNHFFSAKPGNKGVLNLIHHLVNLHKQSLAQDLTENSTPQINNTFQLIQKRVKPGNMIFFLSNFDFLSLFSAQSRLNEKKRFWLQLTQLKKHNELLSGFIYDPLDVSLPDSGNYQLSNNHKKHKEILTLNTDSENFKQDYRQRFIDFDADISSQLLRIGAHFMRCATHQDATQEMREFLSATSSIHNQHQTQFKKIL